MRHPNFDRLAVFGDSLSDTGGIYRLTDEVLIDPFPLDRAGYSGAASNGPVHSEILPDLIGVRSDVYALAGARAIGERPLWQVMGLGSARPPFGDAPAAPLVRPDARLERLDVDVNLGAQVDRFLAEPPGQGLAAAFLIGLNDIATLDTESPSLFFEALAVIGGIVSETTDAVRTVVEAGAAEVILYTYPNAGFLPDAASFDPATLVASEFLVARHADALRNLAADLRADGTPAHVIDLAALTTAIDADPAGFGFAAKGPILLGAGTDPVIIPTDGPSQAPVLGFPENPDVANLDPDAVQFFDMIHPTTATHGIIAAFTAASLTRNSKVLGDTGTLTVHDAGHDFVMARGGSDIVALGAGDDLGLGGTGADKLFGGEGRDLLGGGSGDDVLRGGEGRDLLAGGPGDDSLIGGESDDILSGGTGSDDLQGRAGRDTFIWTDRRADDDADTVSGGDGVDTVWLPAETVSASGPVRLDVLRTVDRMWDLSPLGIEIDGIERVRFYTDLSDIPTPAPDLLAEADAWALL